MATLIVFVQFVLVVELFRAQCATEFLFLVATLDPLVPEQTVPPFVPLPATETNVDGGAVVPRALPLGLLLRLAPAAGRELLKAGRYGVWQLQHGERIWNRKRERQRLVTIP